MLGGVGECGGGGTVWDAFASRRVHRKRHTSGGTEGGKCVRVCDAVRRVAIELCGGVPREGGLMYCALLDERW